jgi:hypothetical protein
MGCLHGKQEFWIDVHWHTAIAKSNFQFDATTSSRYTSSLEVSEWFAHPAVARTEIERVFEELGKDIATRLVAREASGCSLVPQPEGPGWRAQCTASGARGGSFPLVPIEERLAVPSLLESRSQRPPDSDSRTSPPNAPSQ